MSRNGKPVSNRMEQYRMSVPGKLTWLNLVVNTDFTITIKFGEYYYIAMLLVATTGITAKFGGYYK